MKRATTRGGIRTLLALAWLLVALWPPASAAGHSPKYHANCYLTAPAEFQQLAGDVQLSHFTCRIKGGLLDGFTTTTSYIWTVDHGAGKLLACVGFAHKPGANLLFVFKEGTLKVKTSQGRVIVWESSGSGIYKAASGSAAPLAGKAFRLVSRLADPGMLTLDNTLED